MGKVKNIEQYGWNGQKAQKLLAQGNGHKQHALYLCFTLRPAIFNSLRPVTVGSGRIG